MSTAEMEAARLARDPRSDGQFFVCVKSTGIFCIPSCKARTPKPGNVEYVRTREEAIAKGFRGCKRCRAEFFPDTEPPWLPKVVACLRKETASKMREQDLSSVAGVNISTVRRYFNLYCHTTPMAFYRKVRLERARELMVQGVPVLTAAFETGYDSSSGFRDAFVKQFGYPPGRIHGATSSRVQVHANAAR